MQPIDKAINFVKQGQPAPAATVPQMSFWENIMGFFRRGPAAQPATPPTDLRAAWLPPQLGQLETKVYPQETGLREAAAPKWLSQLQTKEYPQRRR